MDAANQNEAVNYSILYYTDSSDIVQEDCWRELHGATWRFDGTGATGLWGRATSAAFRLYLLEGAVTLEAQKLAAHDASRAHVIMRPCAFLGLALLWYSGPRPRAENMPKVPGPVLCRRASRRPTVVDGDTLHPHESM